jgi:cleavage and polyadenylation specificity factor subunit 3
MSHFDANTGSAVAPYIANQMISGDSAGEQDTMYVMPLGGGQEVGRSSILLQFRGRNILLDCGSHPGREGSDSLPFFDSLDDPGDIDLILVTHFHIDHCAALPYFTEKTNFKGRIFMTHATKAVMKLLLSDNIKLQTRSRPLYTDKELQSCVDKIEVIDYHETVEYKGALTYEQISKI